MIRLIVCFSFLLTVNSWAAKRPIRQAQGKPVRQAQDRPNFVFILVDDLGRQDLSIEGSSFYETPNVDRIARKGMRFAHAYSTCQVCSPSRASIQTGKYPARLAITDYIGGTTGRNQPDKWKRNTKLLPARYEMQMELEEVTIAEALKQAGYTTFFAGKWHLGHTGFGPEEQGYDINQGGHIAGTPPGGYFAPYNNPALKDGPPGEELPVRLGRETAKFIADQKARSTSSGEHKPFFAMLSFYSVHGPIQSTEARWKKYRAKAEKMGLIQRDDPRFLLDRTKEVRQVQDHPVYAGMMEAMDEGVGLVLDELEKQGLADNTVVFFTSDNGGVSSGDGFATSCLPLRGGKGRQWEGGIRQPLYISWPGVTPGGTTTDVPVTGTDFYPTILQMAGAPLRPKQHLDGVSLMDVLRGGDIADRPLFWHYPHYGNQGGEPSAMIRKGEWKLINYFEDNRTELYHVNRDLSERENLAAAESDRAAAMLKELKQWQKSVGARFPTKNPNWNGELYEKQMQALDEKGIPNRNRQHAEFLNEDYAPRGGWWQDRKRKQAARKKNQ